MIMVVTTGIAVTTVIVVDGVASPRQLQAVVIRLQGNTCNPTGAFAQLIVGAVLVVVVDLDVVVVILDVVVDLDVVVVVLDVVVHLDVVLVVLGVVVDLDVVVVVLDVVVDLDVVVVVFDVVVGLLGGAFLRLTVSGQSVTVTVLKNKLAIR